MSDSFVLPRLSPDGRAVAYLAPELFGLRDMPIAEPVLDSNAHGPIRAWEIDVNGTVISIMVTERV